MGKPWIFVFPDSPITKKIIFFCRTIILPEDGSDTGVVATLASIPGLIIGIVYDSVQMGHVSCGYAHVRLMERLRRFAY